MSFKNYIEDNIGVIFIYKDMIDIKNYQDIISFDDNKFRIKLNDKQVNFIGKNISVKLLKKEELILVGEIFQIEYR